MNNASKRKQQNSLVRLIRRRLLVVTSLLVFAFLFNFLVGLYVSNRQYNLGEQKDALQKNQDGILIAMLNQETGLRGYIATNSPVFLKPFNTGRPQFLHSVQQLKDQAKGTQVTDFSGTTMVLAQVVAQAERLDRPPYHLVHLLARGDVGPQPERLAPLLDDLLGCASRAVGVDVRAHDICALARKDKCRGLADAAGCAGDDDRLANEIIRGLRHGSSPRVRSGGRVAPGPPGSAW